MCTDIKTLVDISSLFIPVIAIIGIYIAWQQSITNREKIRLELYDKRFKLYDTIISSLNNFSYGSEFTHEKYVRFFTACSEAQFLVPDRICEKINVVNKLIREGRIIKNKLERYEKKEVINKEKEAIVEKIIKIESDIEKLYPSISEAFKEVLKFEKF